MELSPLHLSVYIVGAPANLLIFKFVFGTLRAVPFQLLPSTVPALHFSPYAAATAMIPVSCGFGVSDHVP